MVPTKDPSSVDECLAATCGLLSRWGILVNVELPHTYGQGHCVVRLCAQVYLEKSDFVSVGEKVLQLLQEYHDSAHRSAVHSTSGHPSTPSVHARNPCG